METRNSNLKALALTALMTLALSQVATAAPDRLIHQYFPLHEGDRWVFVQQSAVGIDHPTEDPYLMEEVRVTGSRPDWSGNEIFDVSNYMFQLGDDEIQFLASEGGASQAVEFNGGTTGVWYRFEEGQAIDIPAFANDCIHGSKGTVMRRTNRTVPAGSFRDCLEIGYNLVPCAKKGLVSEIFAPGIGLIQRTINVGGSLEVWSLKYAQVNGYVFPRPADNTDHAMAASPTTPLQASSWGNIKATFQN